MFDWTTLAIFYSAALALNLTPGNDMTYVLGQSLKSGTRVGNAASFGIAAGGLVHLALVALGVAVVLAQNPLVFDGLLYCGAAYLLWIAFQTLRAPMAALRPEEVGRSAWVAFRDGVVVSVFNPKNIVFMFAFLPPFIHAEQGSPLLQLLVLGMIFNVSGTVINCMVAFSAGRIGRGLSQSESFRRWFARISAGLFLVLAARLVLSER
jgi:threonine/homoserine/homoserine lactone efflux protein